MTLESRGTGCLTLCSILLLLAISGIARAQESAGYFQTNCASCHTIGGGPLVGPDLQNLEQRKDREWMLKFLANPQAVIDSGDPYAKKMLAESNGVIMPPVSGLDHEQIEALLDWIAAQSKSKDAQSAAAAPAAEPVFTPADAALGRELMLGTRPLANGGPPCISCHAFHGAPMLGGGTLGPDLTHEFSRLGGGRAATAWLSSPPTPTMKADYATHALKPEEAHALAAYLDSISKQEGGGAAARAEEIFFLIGLGGCLIALVAMDMFWKRRFHAVRRPLVAGKSER